MLVELSIRDLALIQQAELLFGPGLNVISGETGAGKSLLVGAFGLLLGEAPRGGIATLVREGAEFARVEGRFSCSESEPLAGKVLAWLKENQPEEAEEWESGERELILGRTAGVDGRTRAHVNGRPVTRRALRLLSGVLLEVHGQNEHQKLLEQDEQTRLLDGFGGLADKRREYARLRGDWIAAAERIRRLEEEKAQRLQRLEFLRFQCGELANLELAPGERGALTQEREILRGAGDMQAQLGAVVEELFEADGSIRERLQLAERVVGAWRERIPDLEQSFQELRGAVVCVEEAASALASRLDGIEMNPQRLEEVEDRLADIERFEHKHGVRGDALLERLQDLERDIEELEAGERSFESLAEEVELARNEMVAWAAELSRGRRLHAPKLAEEAVRALAGLGLEKAEVAVELRPRRAGLLAADEDGTDELGAHPALEDDLRRFGPLGADEVEFLLAANPGEPRRSLRDVVSGGEAARIMLALRGVLAGCDPGRLLVFDEIDSGVGGRLGPAVGTRMRALAEHHQVLCVTHLPAIAAMAHTHLRVSKSTRRGRTHTSVHELAGDERVQEIADMIAGGAEQETARAEARRLLESV